MGRGWTFVVVFLMAPALLACRVTKSLTEQQIKKADLIFEGRAVGLITPSCRGLCQGLIVGPRRVTFKIDKVVAGHWQAGQIEVYWQNGNFGEVETLTEFHSRYGPRSRVGVLFPGTIQKGIQCQKVAATNGAGNPTTVESCQTSLPLPIEPRSGTRTDLPWILGEVCSESYLIPVNRKGSSDEI